MRELEYEKIGRRIRQVRKAKGWSQNDLAERCGISMSFLGHIERGSRIMSMETFANICNALDAGADELLFGVAGASVAVLDMWKRPEKDKRNHSKNRLNKENPDKTVHAETDKQEAENETGSEKADSYAMYVRIMKSVAEIMNGK